MLALAYRLQNGFLHVVRAKNIVKNRGLKSLSDWRLKTLRFSTVLRFLRVSTWVRGPGSSMERIERRFERPFAVWSENGRNSKKSESNASMGFTFRVRSILELLRTFIQLSERETSLLSGDLRIAKEEKNSYWRFAPRSPVRIWNMLDLTVLTAFRLAIRGWTLFSLARYLVDPASSHMLVSKIKPCMSKYKPH